KQDCPTCRLIVPVIGALASRADTSLSIYIQDDPAFLQPTANRHDDSSLEFSFRHDIEVVPTLISMADGKELERIYGWDRNQWRAFTGISDLGATLPDFKPGCGSKIRDPGMTEVLELRFGAYQPASRSLLIDESEDLIEACFDRGWSDGLPVVPPTPLRVHKMLKAGGREAEEIIGSIPPDYVSCTVEKAAINAVLAGCKPEYFPTVLAVIEAALDERFCLHGLLCTTYFSSPVVIVSGPESRRIGMNSGVNALGQGNRANATIGRALQLLVRNVGGGKPGGIDRAALGTPGKYTFCFSEDESNPDWPSLAMDRGFDRQDSVVSLFAGDGVQGILDQQSRLPESLARSLALSLRTVANAKLFMMADAILVLSPEHRRVFVQGGWSKAQVKQAIIEALRTPGSEIIRGVGGIAEGMPAQFKDKTLNKFRDDGFHIVSAGGTAGLFSAIIGGWVASGERGSQLVSKKL
ncbi:MAG: hypothetical protein WD772_11160, partial [Pseudohongiellaceae bacterium]